MGGSLLKLVVIFVCFNLIKCTAIPLVLWSTSELLVHQFPDDVVGNVEAIASTFSKPNYNNNVIVFIKGQMTYEDFARFGDVYNSNGNGGVLKNIMKYTETHPSRHFTLDRNGFVDKLSSGAWSAVHKLNAAQLSEEELQSKLKGIAESILPSSRHLILVDLGSLLYVQDKDMADVLATADRIVKFSVDTMTKSKAYQLTAIFIGSNDFQKNHEDDNTLYFNKRRLLSVEPVNEAIFVNDSGLFLYFKSLEVTQNFYLSKSDKKLAGVYRETIGNITGNITAVVSKSDNKTMELMLTLSRLPIISLKISMSFNTSILGDWLVSEVMLLELRCLYNCTDLAKTSLGLPLWLTAPHGYSYHCSNTPSFSTDRVNVSTQYTEFTLKFNEFQLQPFGAIHQFGPPNECIGLFTVPIWSGLFVTLLLILILAYGLGMVSSITTMDRFDDPRSKPLLVNTGGDNM